MAPDQSILKDNFIECLRSADRAIVASFAILFFGSVTARYGSAGATITLPINQLSVGSLEIALQILLGLHFVNGLRYSFFLLRARSIGKRLDMSILKAARSFPAAATSNVMTEVFVTGILSVLSAPIIERLFAPPTWLALTLAILVSSPFIIASVATDSKLNAGQDEV